jgi:hypothetical protein
LDDKLDELPLISFVDDEKNKKIEKHLDIVDRKTFQNHKNPPPDII